jgi:hypothetical protein
VVVLDTSIVGVHGSMIAKNQLGDAVSVSLIILLRHWFKLKAVHCIAVTLLAQRIYNNTRFKFVHEIIRIFCSYRYRKQTA